MLEACTYQAIDQLTLREVHAELSGERILTNQVMSNMRLRRRHRPAMSTVPATLWIGSVVTTTIAIQRRADLNGAAADKEDGP